MDLNVWTVTAVTFIVLARHGTMFFWKLFNVNAITAGDMCDFMNMKTIDCMLSMRRDKFKTKMAISSNYVVRFLHLLTTA